MIDPIRNEIDGAAIAGSIGVFLGYLPSVVAVVTIAWVMIRIWETDTVRGWTRRLQKGPEK